MFYVLFLFARGRVFVDVHPLQTGRGLVSRRRPAAAGSMSHSQKHVGPVRVQDETLHGCEAQIATLCRTNPCAVATRTSVRWRCAGRSLARPRSFSSANIGQLAVNVTPSTPTVHPPLQVRDYEVPTLPFSTLIGERGRIRPQLLLDHMAIKAIARVDLAKYDVILVHI